MTPPSKSTFIERRIVDLKANVVKPVNIYGRVFACTAATAPFKMNFNRGEFFQINGRGSQWGMAGDDFYEELAFCAAVDATIEFYGGNFFWLENVVTPVTKVAQTVIKAGPIIINAGTVVDFPGVGPAASGYGYRKDFIVTNLSTTLDLGLLAYEPDGTLDPIQVLFPRTPFKIETSAKLRLQNAQSVNIALSLFEIFYTAE